MRPPHLLHLILPLLLLTPALFAADPAPAPSSPPAANPPGNTPDVALQRKLDQPLTLDLQKVELSEAFRQIATTAGIALQVDPACYELLPYGSTTRVSATFRQSKLRDALEEILLPLGLQQAVSAGGAGAGGAPTVVIRPSNPLAHIGRRADWEELKLMQELRTAPDLKPPASRTESLDLTLAIRAALDGRKDLVVSIAGGNGDPTALDQIRKQLPMSPYRALELYCQLTSQIWFVEAGPLAGGPTGGTIRIMSPRQWIEQRQLERPIQIAASNQPLEQVVADLSHASGIRFVPEPGLYQAVPVVSVTSTNASVRQTLEALAGTARIAFDIRDDSILLHLAPSPGSEPPAKSDIIIGRFTLTTKDGAAVDIFLHESDLPPQLNDLRKKRLQEAIDTLQRSLTNTPLPATQPATAPTPVTQPTK
jgi:hypothetical protein